MTTIPIFFVLAVSLTIAFYLSVTVLLRIRQSADSADRTPSKAMIFGISFLDASLVVACVAALYTPPPEPIRTHDVESARLIAELLAQPKYQEPLRLARFEGKVFSQNGEDGILAEIFRRIGVTNRQFVEFGSADGLENNTVYLLRMQGWGGVWLDGDDALIARARRHFAKEVGEKRLNADVAFITAENVEQLFAAHGVPKEPDLLSIDIDRNDWHVWKAIQAYRPRVVVIEYNSVFSPAIDWVVPYDGQKWWDHTVNFGASLKAYERLGTEKGYKLVGCNFSGINAFFVRDDLVGEKFAAPYTAENHYEPPRYWMTWSGHTRQP
ncbi:MAG TPA: hypothetical protein VN903_23825 [Polyangia bacterium]|jgi:hypothetical protein|nr:hypothetical protein [Polyangia bacterium]